MDGLADLYLIVDLYLIAIHRGCVDCPCTLTVERWGVDVGRRALPALSQQRRARGVGGRGGARLGGGGAAGGARRGDGFASLCQYLFS